MVTHGDLARRNSERAPHEADGHPACALVAPGHLVRADQVRKFWEPEPDGPVRWGRFLGAEGGDLVVGFLDGTRRYRIHRPAEVAGVAHVGDKVRVSERRRVASISRRFEQLLLVSIALPEDPYRPCCSMAPGEPASLDDRPPDGAFDEVS